MCCKRCHSLLSITSSLSYNLFLVSHVVGTSLWALSCFTENSGIYLDKVNVKVHVKSLLDRENLIYKVHALCEWGRDESSGDKFYSNIFNVGPLTASLGTFLDTCLSMSCSCMFGLFFFLFVCKVKLMMNWVSPPLSDVNCLLAHVNDHTLPRQRVWAVHNLWPNLSLNDKLVLCRF